MGRILLILGGGVKAFNSLLGTQTLLRCQRGYQEILDNYRNGIFYDRIILSGGICSPQNIQTFPEAVLMYCWFMENWLPEYVRSRFIIERQSRDSFQNVEFSIDKLRETSAVNEYDMRLFQGFDIPTYPLHGSRVDISLSQGYGIGGTKILPVPCKLTTVQLASEIAYQPICYLDPKGRGYIPQRLRNSRTYHYHP